jgi:uncharacterized membrane protein
MKDEWTTGIILGAAVGFLVGLMTYQFMNMKTLNKLSFYEHTCFKLMEEK